MEALESNKYLTNRAYKKHVDELQSTLKAINKAKKVGKLGYFQVSQRVGSDGALRPSISVLEFGASIRVGN